MAPKRIQRKRTKGWKLPEGAVCVTRPGKWGNPFIVSPKVKPGSRSGVGYIAVPTVEDAIDCFREMLLMKPDFVEGIKVELSGKDLACFCPLDQPCHADVLLEIANAVAGDGV